MKNKNNVQLKPYQSIDETTGEVVSLIKYLEGNPRQYRFNGQTGRFNLNGIHDKGVSFKLLPIAWRIFKSELFGRNRQEIWAELFFIDNDNCLSSIMFNNTSVQILQNMFGQVVYDGLILDDVLLTITCDKRVNAKVNSSYYVAQFSFEKAEKEFLELNKSFAKDHNIYRQDTITQEESTHLSSNTYRPASHVLLQDAA